VARKERPSAEQRGRSELLGILMIAGAVLLFLALVSYDRHDLDFNRVPANANIHNLLGRVGARVAWSLFFTFGAAAYLPPVLLLAFGSAAFVPSLSEIRRSGRTVAGTIGLLITAVGGLDLFAPALGGLRTHIDSMWVGGIFGKVLNERVMIYLFNRMGATIIYLTLYLVSIYWLTGFHALEWLRRFLEERAAARSSSPQAKEAAIDRERTELESKARKLREQLNSAKAVREAEATTVAGEDIDEPQTVAAPVSKKNKSRTEEPQVRAEEPASGLGADLKPIPEPTFRDNSFSKVRAPGSKVFESENPFAIKSAPTSASTPVAEGETISAREVAATASTESVLGRKSTLKGGDRGDKPNETTAPISEFSVLDATLTPQTGDVQESAAAPAGSSGSVPPWDVGPTTPSDSPGTHPITPPAPLVRSRPPVRRPKPITVASTPMIGNYQLPSLDLLNMPDFSVRPTESKEELMANSRLMVQTLAQFGIEVAPGDITRGPTITRYELHPAPGVKLEKVAALTNNLAAALKAERIHVLAPVPGKSSVGVEVPNAVKTKVIMRDLLESPEWLSTKARIPLALGKDVYGHPIIADLAEMPHCLIAGSTGSGKSVCINSIIASLLFKFTPDQLRFVMIDPKVVELQQYNALPHLVVPVVTDPKKVILALRWVVNEMEKRYQIFAKVGVRNIRAFNERPKDKPLPIAEPELPLMAKKEKVEPGADGFAVEVDEQIVVPRDEDIIIPEKLSYIVVIIDELADLMLVAPADVEMAIARITQMARAAGIHCIVATQRPSVDVITGVIKANIPARIAFQVAAKVDSRTILDQMGADKLLGKGDMLYLPPGSGRLNRAQGVLITDQEIEKVVNHIAKQGKPSYEVEIHQALQKAPSSMGNMPLDPDADDGSGDYELIEKCIDVIRTEKKASVSLLQRRLKLGYGRASRLMDQLEERGIVGPNKGAEPRDILLDLDGEGYDGGGQQMV